MGMAPDLDSTLRSQKAGNLTFCRTTLPGPMPRIHTWDYCPQASTYPQHCSVVRAKARLYLTWQLACISLALTLSTGDRAWPPS
jgi:hypothetical protein